MPDGMTSAPPEPLRIVNSGVKYGVAANGMVAWLPPKLWAPAAELRRLMERQNAAAEEMQRLWQQAQDAAWQAAADEQNRRAMGDG